MATRGFAGRPGDDTSNRLPPGQYLERGFPVLSYEPTPTVDTSEWQFSIETAEGSAAWTWKEMQGLPQTEMKVDIHCVTKWSKFDTPWLGVSIDDFLDAAGIELSEPYVLASCYSGYTTNLPTEDVLGERAMVAHTFRRGTARADARRPGEIARASPVLLEISEVDPRLACSG